MGTDKDIGVNAYVLLKHQNPIAAFNQFRDAEKFVEDKYSVKLTKQTDTHWWAIYQEDEWPMVLDLVRVPLLWHRPSRETSETKEEKEQSMSDPVVRKASNKEKYAVRAYKVIQYDGTNSADIISYITSFVGMSATIVSQSGGVLTLHALCTPGFPVNWEGDVTVNTNDWVFCVNEMVQVVTNADFSGQWVTKL